VLTLAREVRRRRVALLHSFDFYSNVAAVLTARLTGRHAVASQRELGDLKTRGQRRAQRFLLRRADAVVVNSEAVAERVRREARIASRRIALVRNTVSHQRFSVARLRRAALGPPVIGMLAQLRPEKGALDFVRAAALVRQRCPAARFVIWGDGECRPAVEAEIRRHGLDAIVVLAGATAEPERALAEMDVFVLPSLSEACSNALLEAMASGLPVVATRVGGTPRVVQDHVTGLLVAPGAPVELADAVLRVLGDRDLATSLGEAAAGWVRVRHDAARIVAGVEALYTRVLAGGP
jgi:glycosyltransferase involved in cell wall biosynthesis